MVMKDSADLSARTRRLFLVLLAMQALHSTEEFTLQLWTEFAPARFVVGLISENPETGFLIANISIILFGVWCALYPVRRQWPSASGFLWFWVVLETINGLGHQLVSIIRQEYVPGLVTAIVLLPVAIVLARELLRDRQNQ